MSNRVIHLRGNRIVVFVIPFHEKTASGLYLGNSYRDSYKRFDHCWPVLKGPDCSEDVVLGGHYRILNNFVHDDFPLDLWEQYATDPRFKAVIHHLEQYGGKPWTRVLREPALAAVHEDNSQ